MDVNDSDSVAFEPPPARVPTVVSLLEPTLRHRGIPRQINNQEETVPSLPPGHPTQLPKFWGVLAWPLLNPMPADHEFDEVRIRSSASKVNSSRPRAMLDPPLRGHSPVLSLKIPEENAVKPAFLGLLASQLLSYLSDCMARLDQFPNGDGPASAC